MRIGASPETGQAPSLQVGADPNVEFHIRGEIMKRAAVIRGILSIAIWAEARNSGEAVPHNPPAAGQTVPAQGATLPPAKRPPQTKTQPEFDAWKAAAANTTDPAAAEKAADDFAGKFPDSEVRVLLYQNAMRLYQNANNAEKTEAMGRKVLSLDGDHPEALVAVAGVIGERTRDADIDKDQRFSEASAMALKVLQTADTDISVPAGRRTGRSTFTSRICARTLIRFWVPLSSRKRITRPRRRICRRPSTPTPATRLPWTFFAWRWRSISRENLRRR